MPIVTRQELIDAQRDVSDLATVVNGPANPGTLTSRNGTPLKTLARVLLDMDPTGISAQLEKIASDAWLTQGEKPQYIREWDTLNGEKSSIILNAAVEGVSSSAYETALDDLEGYLSALSPAWNSTGYDTPIVPATWLLRWSTVYRERTALLAQLSVTAHGVATGAASSAGNALAQLLRIGSDDWLTTGEKRPAIIEREAAVNSNSDLLAKATARSIDSSAYETAYQRLMTFLASVPGGGIYDLTQDSDLASVTYPNDSNPSNPYESGSAWRQAWTSFYVEQANLQAAIAAAGTIDNQARLDAALAQANAQQALNDAALANAGLLGKADTNLGNLPDGTIVNRMLAAQSVLATNIGAHTITATEIYARTITAAEIAAGTITANEIASRTITADRIQGGSITAYEIASRTITADRIAAGAITANELSANCIQTSNYTEDGSGYPTAGAKMDKNGTALKVAPGNLQIGSHTLADTIGVQLASPASFLALNSGWTCPTGTSTPKGLVFAVDVGAFTSPKKMIVFNLVVTAPSSSMGSGPGTVVLAYRPFDAPMYGVGWDATAGSAVLFTISSSGAIAITPTPVASHAYRLPICIIQ